MRIIVIGGAGLPEQVAVALHKAGDEVTVIDTDPGREAALVKAGLRSVRGQAAVPSTLEAAGALRADVLVACTTVGRGQPRRLLPRQEALRRASSDRSRERRGE